MEITQGFRHSYSDGKTDRLEVELSIIYFSKHSCLPHSGISEILSFRLDCVHGLDRYNSVVFLRRVTSQRMGAHSFSSFCFITHSWLVSVLPLFFGGFGVLHQPEWLPCLISNLIYKAKPTAPISVYISDSSCILNITISFLKFPSIVVTECLVLTHKIVLQKPSFLRTVLNR